LNSRLDLRACDISSASGQATVAIECTWIVFSFAENLSPDQKLKAILVPGEAASISPHGRRTVAAVAMVHPRPLALFRIPAPGAAKHGISHGLEVAVILAHRIGTAAIGGLTKSWQQSDAEY
jgi:hypothetical protein